MKQFLLELADLMQKYDARILEEILAVGEETLTLPFYIDHNYLKEEAEKL